MKAGVSGVTGYQLFMMVVQVIALLVMFVNLIYVSQQGPSSLQSPLIVLMFSTIIMFIGYIVEIEGENLETSMVGVAIAYLGKPYVMLASFRFICAFYQRKIPKPLYYSPAIFSSLFFLVVYTNKYHYLYYAAVTYDRSQQFSPLTLSHGSLYYTYVVTAVVYFIACLYEVYVGYRHSGSSRKNRYAVYILGMVVFGVVGCGVYLSGMTGEEIPLSAGIVAVADVFDAVTRKRCYKETLTGEETFKLVREESGEHFDPQVVEAFMRIMGQEQL